MERYSCKNEFENLGFGNHFFNITLLRNYSREYKTVIKNNIKPSYAISYLLLYVTNYLNTQWLEKNILFYSVCGIWLWLGRVLQLMDPHKASVRVSTWAASSQGLTGAESTSQITHNVVGRIQFLAGCRTKGLSSLLLGLSIRLMWQLALSK